MANKAIGSIQFDPNTTTPSWQFTYGVINPSGTFIATANAFVAASYADKPYDVWAKVVAQVRSDQGDSGLTVVPPPCSLELLMYGKTY